MPTTGPEEESNLNQKVAAEQVKLLYAQDPSGFALGIIMTVFIVVCIHSQIASDTLYIWGAVMIVITAVDFMSFFAYGAKPTHYYNYKPWYKYYVFSVGFMGGVWGLSTLYLIVQLTPTYQMFITMLLVGIASSGLSLVSSRIMPLVMFTLGLFLPIIVWQFSQGEYISICTALFLVFYVGSIIMGGFQISTQIEGSLKLRFQNENLASLLNTNNAELLDLNQQLYRISTTDELTQVGNRRFFETQLDDEWKRLTREHGEIALIMIDVDHFKAFNDTLGHQAGDDCLTQVARRLSSTLRRPADIIARYGGEEFVVILPNTSQEGALHIAEELRFNIEELEVEHTTGNEKSKVTISLGISSVLPTKSLSQQQLITHADKALYKAKDAGRNLAVYLPFG